MNKYQVIVIGAGHAGIEASLASSNLGLKTAMLTLDLDNIGAMSCNPSIGGPAKSHLVKELDALGGYMGVNMDKSYVQTRVLNTKKGPAVRSLRFQADRKVYAKNMKKKIEQTPNLDVIQDIAIEILHENNKIIGIKTKNGLTFLCDKLILCTGTFLNGLMYIGEKRLEGGRMGELSSKNLTDSLIDMGLTVKRFKTGTSPRIDARTIDFSQMEEQKGEVDKNLKFSNFSNNLDLPQLSCYITRTTKETKKIIEDNIHLAPMYNGAIDSTGPRYCPSIEDKIMKFSDKETHHLFLEPEGFDTNEVYISGLSTSFPPDIQQKIVNSIPGMENAKIMRYGYAVEYDYVPCNQLDYTLETKKIKGLYLAGQINGTSGYEEAATQGFIAGANAALSLLNKEPLILDRNTSYIGTMIDDLITKEIFEPYRMFTARSEYRLYLREDNADIRLMPIGHKIGLITDEQLEKLNNKIKTIDDTIMYLKNTNIGISNKVLLNLLEQKEENLKSGTTLLEILRRPKFSYQDIKEIAKSLGDDISFDDDIEYQIEVQVKYEGYISKSMQQIEKQSKLESKKIPFDFDYTKLQGITREAKQRLNEYRPYNIGQASRISGVTPADISVLLMYLDERLK